VEAAFGENGKLHVLTKLKSDPAFTAQTIKNLQEGQKFLSTGVVAGFRNPAAHIELQKLKETDAMTFQDCLDALGIVSHLLRRLDDSATNP
jgi:hypothetical protein